MGHDDYHLRHAAVDVFDADRIAGCRVAPHRQCADGIIEPKADRFLSIDSLFSEPLVRHLPHLLFAQQLAEPFEMVVFIKRGRVVGRV